MDEEDNKGKDIEQHVRVFLIYQRCKYMIDDHKDGHKSCFEDTISEFYTEILF